MNLNLFRLFSEAKVNYIALVCRCCFVLAICGVLFFPSLTTYSATGGGGSTRGGGTGSRSMLTTVPYALELTRGYVVSDNEGGLRIAPFEGDNYTAFRRIDTSTRVDSKTITARQKGVQSLIITGMPNKFWVSFYNYKGSHTLLGTSPKFQGVAVLEVPANTTYVIISSDRPGTGRAIFSSDVSNIPVDLQDVPVQDKRTSFSKFNNQWMLNLFIDEWSGKNLYGEIYDYNGVTKSNNLGAMYRYKVESGQSFSITHDSGGSGNLLALIHYYDIEGNWVGFAHNSMVPGQTVSFTVNSGNASYVQMWFQASQNLSVAEWSTRFNLVGLGEGDVYSNFYQVDNSSTSTIINYHNHSTKNYSVESGDNSPVVIIDGNGNTITFPGASPIVNTPPEGVIIPGDGSPGDDDSDGGFFDIIGDLFGSIGNLLKGLMNIILTPIKLLVDTITEMIDTVTGTLSATSGMNEFFANLFGWLPSPIPGLLGMAIGSFIIIAIIKFLRG